DIAEEDSEKYLSFAQDIDKTISPKQVDTIVNAIIEKKIIVTNHAYLFILYRLFGGKGLSVRTEARPLFFTTPIIFDEFHSMFDAAKTILSKSFSLFRLQYSINGILKHIDEKNNGTHIKRLKTILTLISKHEHKIKGVTKKEDVLPNLALLKAEVAHLTSIEKTMDKLISIENASNNIELEKYIRFTRNELSELSSINFTNSKKINVSFSPSGFPRVIAGNNFPIYEMRKTLWLRNKGKILCMSGTLRVENSTLPNAFKWYMDRNGLFVGNQEGFKQRIDENKEMDDTLKELLIMGNEKLVGRIEKIIYKAYPSLFEKSNFLYTIVDHQDFTVPMGGADNYQEKVNTWRRNIGVFVANNLQFNSLVLSTSFLDAEGIANAINEIRGDDVKVFFAHEGHSMHNLVKQYKEAVDKKYLCCLVGTEQYYTGLNLDGEYLNELYLAKIPFSPARGRVGEKIVPGMGISQEKNYVNEILTKFKQGIGRPIRDFNDKAIMYVLDSRILKPARQVFKSAVDEKAIEVSFYGMNSRYKRALIDTKKDKERKGIALYTLFFGYLATMNTNEIETLFDIKEEERETIDVVAQKILFQDISIEYVMTKEYFDEVIKRKSFKNIWILLLKIYSSGMKKKGIEVEKEIIENDFFGYKGNLLETAKFYLTQRI
ncbi:MAG: hypothetical protein EOM11_09450, partial [Erysipelotrichia bacterium]|nr:hypothetical protein [Erysipelotrichia bacterium]